MKPEPHPDEANRFFFEGGSDGRLRIARCQSCGYYVHPPSIVCPRCLDEELVPEPVSGRGTLYSWVVARQAFATAFLDELPYVLAMVELEEQPGLRVLTNIVGVPKTGEGLEIGIPVEVTFERRGEWYVPMFRPSAGVPA